MAEMAETEICVHKRHHVCATLWEACVRWLAVLLHLVLQLVEYKPSIRQLLCLFGLNQVSNPEVPAFKSLPAESSAEKRERNLLPPRTGEDADKLTVVLDMDETLVCAYESSSLPPLLHSQASEAGVNWFELQCASVDKEGEGKQKINYVTVYERPGLREFLARASEFAEIVLFTAGLEGYARPVVDKIDPENKITARLYRPATVTTKYREHVKDLSRLGRDLRRTVIVDNNPFSFLLQPLNGIPCIPFTGAHPDDQQLLRVLLPLLKHLATQKDIRPILHESTQALNTAKDTWVFYARFATLDLYTVAERVCVYFWVFYARFATSDVAGIQWRNVFVFTDVNSHLPKSWQQPSSVIRT